MFNTCLKILLKHIFAFNTVSTITLRKENDMVLFYHTTNNNTLHSLLLSRLFDLGNTFFLIILATRIRNVWYWTRKL